VAVARRVQERAKGDPWALLLATMPGMGHPTALLVLAETGDISPFPSGRALSS
jgi:transposase